MERTQVLIIIIIIIIIIIVIIIIDIKLLSLLLLLLGLSTPGHPKARSVARGDPPEGEAVRRPRGPEEDGVVRASHRRGRLEEAIEEEEVTFPSFMAEGAARF